MKATLILSLALLANVLLTAGCSSPEIYTGERTSRDRILLPTPAVIPQPALATVGDLAAVIPIVGSVKIAADEKRANRIGAALALDGFDLANEFREGLASELRKLGAPDVSAVSLRRATPNPFDLWPDEQELTSGTRTDCFVDVLLVYGFVSPVTGAGYQPYMVANLTIVRGEDQRTSYAEKFFYNFLGRDIEVTPTTPLRSWKSSAAVEADVRGARESFRSAIGDLSAYISQHLKAIDHFGKC